MYVIGVLRFLQEVLSKMLTNYKFTSMNFSKESESAALLSGASMQSIELSPSEPKPTPEPEHEQEQEQEGLLTISQVKSLLLSIKKSLKHIGGRNAVAEALIQSSTETSTSSRITTCRLTLLSFQKDSVTKWCNSSNNPSQLTVEQVQSDLSSLTQRKVMLTKNAVSSELTSLLHSIDSLVRENFILGLQDAANSNSNSNSNSTFITTSPMTKQQVVDFLETCVAMVKCDTFIEQLKSHFATYGKVGDLLVDLQGQCLEWCGHEKMSGLESLNGVHKTFGEDQDIQNKLRQFAEAMTTVVKISSQGSIQGISENEDGVTKVISVTYKEVGDGDEGEGEGGGAPEMMGMSQIKEEEQRKQLEMARKAAGLQQQLLGMLLGMEEVEREVLLNDAKKCHNEFVEKALAIETGPERVVFMQTLSAELQQKLIMHKMWESMLEKNGGVPPVVHEL